MNCGNTFLRIFEAIPWESTENTFNFLCRFTLLCLLKCYNAAVIKLRPFVENVEKLRCLLESFYSGMVLYSNTKRTSK